MVGSGDNDRGSRLRQHGPMPAPRALALSLLFLLVGTLITPPGAVAVTSTNLAQRYEIAATLDVSAGRLDAIETLTVTNHSSETLDHLNLSVVPRALGYLAMPEPITVDGSEVDAEWTTGINLRVALPDLEPRQAARLRIPFTLELGRSPDAFTARTSSENGVLSFGQWFPIVSTEHDVYGLGDPQVSFTADVIRLELTTTSALGRNAVACPGSAGGSRRQRDGVDLRVDRRARLQLRREPALPAHRAHGGGHRSAGLHRDRLG